MLVAAKKRKTEPKLLQNLKVGKRPKNEREKRPANEGPARGVRLHILFECKSSYMSMLGGV